MLVVIEGADASGKSTQARMLAEKMKWPLQRFPDRSTPVGKLIDGHLRSELALAATAYDDPPLVLAGGLSDALMFQCMMTVNRLEVGMKLAEASCGMSDLVCDRYSQSGIVYGTADGLDHDLMKRIHQLLPVARVNILIDVPASVCRERIASRAAGTTKATVLDSYERKPGDFLGRVVEGYRKLWDIERRDCGGSCDHWPIVDGMRSVEEVHNEVCRIVRQTH